MIIRPLDNYDSYGSILWDTTAKLILLPFSDEMNVRLDEPALSDERSPSFLVNNTTKNRTTGRWEGFPT